MKPLILVLLIATSVSAQSLPEMARQERERKANLKAVRALTADNTQPASSEATTEKPAETKAPEPAGAKPSETPKTTSSPAATATPSTPVPAKNPTEEAAKMYAEELARLRTKVVELQDQETALQLQLNNLKNAYLAPVTDTAARAQAQSRTEQAQTQLATTRQELANTRRQLQVLEAQGPPRP
jgi:hypothetical protein